MPNAYTRPTWADSATAGTLNATSTLRFYGTQRNPPAPAEFIVDDEIQQIYIQELAASIAGRKSGGTMDVLDFEKTVGEVYGKSGFQKDTSTAYVGIEWENESINPLTLPDIGSGWQFHNEGSLRYHGCEFVLNPPRKLEESKDYVKRLFKSLSGNTWTDSIRTSVHVHFDVTKYKITDIICFGAVYWILEDILSDFAGEHRKSNLFCLRAKDTEYLLTDLSYNVSSKQPFKLHTTENNYRYASVNLAAMKKFGSFEFRMMRGTSNQEDIFLWLDCLESIRQFALRFDTPKALRKYFLEDVSAGSFPNIVLGENFKKIQKYISTQEPIEERVREGFLRVERLLLSGGDWDFTKEIEKQKKKLEEKRLKEQEDARRKAEISSSIFRVPQTFHDDVEDTHRGEALRTDYTGDW